MARQDWRRSEIPFFTHQIILWLSPRRGVVCGVVLCRRRCRRRSDPEADPEAAQVAQAAQARAGESEWIEEIDSCTTRAYWYNPSTHVSTYQNPRQTVPESVPCGSPKPPPLPMGCWWLVAVANASDNRGMRAALVLIRGDSAHCIELGAALFRLRVIVL